MKAAFEVINPKTGQKFTVYQDGRIEGFGEATLVINRIPALVAEAIWGAHADSFDDGVRMKDDPMYLEMARAAIEAMRDDVDASK